MKSLIVILSHAPNPDVRGGYWTEPVDSGAEQKKKAQSLVECSTLCRAYIDRNGLGGGNWTGGEVRRDGKPVAYVSYNGRVWDRKVGANMMDVNELDPVTGNSIEEKITP